MANVEGISSVPVVTGEIIDEGVARKLHDQHGERANILRSEEEKAIKIAEISSRLQLVGHSLRGW